MLIFLNLDGSAKLVTPQNVYQGSNNVTEVSVVAPFPNSTALEIGFIKPDGLEVPYMPMAYKGSNVWTYSLQSTVTDKPGDLYASINAVGTDGNNTSYMVKVVIQESVLPSPPPFPPEEDQWELILQYMQGAFAAADEAMTAVNPLQVIAEAEALNAEAEAYVKLQLIYDGLLIKEWNSLTNSWTQVNPNPTDPTASKWTYKFIYGLPRGEKGQDGTNGTVQWGINNPSPISTLDWIIKN